MNWFKRILSLLLALTLCVSAVPSAAFASEAETPESPVSDATEPAPDPTETSETTEPAPAGSTGDAAVEEESTEPPLQETGEVCPHGRDSCAVCTLVELIGSLPEASQLPGMLPDDVGAVYLKAQEAADLWNSLPEEDQALITNIQKLIDLHTYFNTLAEPAAVPAAFPLPELTGNQAKDVALIAASQLGYKETSSGTIYGQWWNGVTNWGADYTASPWCAMFAAWCASKAGVGLGKAYSKESALVANLWSWYGANATRESAFKTTPAPGDFIFFKNSNGTAGHVAIVTGYNAGTKKVTFVGGNQGDAVTQATVTWSSGGMYGSQAVLGYGRPAYKDNSVQTIAEGSLGASINWVFDSTGTLTLSGTGDMPASPVWEDTVSAAATRLVIQEGITSVGDRAFINFTALETVTLADTVTSIGEAAFYKCTSLKSVQLPKNLTTLGKSAFVYCSALPSITIPEGVTELPHELFAGCTALSSVSLPGSLLVIGPDVFEDCTGLKKLTLPKNLTTIKEKAFIRSGLTTLTIPAGVTELGYMAFYYCTQLTSVSLPSSLSRLEGSTFYHCEALKSITIPQGVRSINYDAFKGCSALTTVSFPDSLSSIEQSAFDSCTALQKVVLPAGVWVSGYAFRFCLNLTTLVVGDECHLAANAFYGCPKLTNITLGENVTAEEGAFSEAVLTGPVGEGLNWAMDLETGVLTISGSGAVPDYESTQAAPWAACAPFIRSVTLEEGLTGLGTYSLYGCHRVTELTIPASVTAISTEAVTYCSSLADIHLSGNAPSLGDNCFGAGALNVHYPPTASGYTGELMMGFPQYTWIPEPTPGYISFGHCGPSLNWKLDTKGVLTIYGSGEMLDYLPAELNGEESAAPWFQVGIVQEVVLEEGVTSIGDYAFHGSALLTKVTFCQSLTSIGTGAFENCPRLWSIDVPAGVRSIEPDAFKNCSRMETITFRGDMPQNNLFTGVTAQGYYPGENASWINGDPYDLGGKIKWMPIGSQPIERETEFVCASLTHRGSEYDLLNGDWLELCLYAQETVSISVRPGFDAMYDSVVEIALGQNGRRLLVSDTGDFPELRLSDWFIPEEPVYLELLDENGNVVERKEFLLRLVESFSVTFYTKYGMNEVPSQEPAIHHVLEYVPGDDFQPPQDPELASLLFVGWYATQEPSGVDYFDEQNRQTRLDAYGDLELYGGWEEDPGFIMGRDSWSFLNDTGYSTTDYQISPADYGALIQGLSWTEREMIRREKEKTFSGFCFGMSAAALMIRAGVVDISKFSPPGSRYNRTADAEIPYNVNDHDVSAVESLITFYQLSQNLGSINSIRKDYNLFNGSDNLKRIIAKMESSSHPVLVGLSFTEYGISVGRHAVIAYGLTETAAGYSFYIYDCSANVSSFYPVTVTVEDGKYSAVHEEWSEAWGGRDVFFRYGLTVSELKSENYLTAPGTVTAVSSTSASSRYDLSTSCPSFTISNGSQTAVIENGQVVSGDFGISCYGCVNMVGAPAEYAFSLPVGCTYTIIPSGSGVCETVMHYDHPADGFFVRVEAQPGQITLSPDGTVSTAYDAPTAQTVSVTANNMVTSWYNVEISGTSCGLTVRPDADTVSVTSRDETTVDITASSDFNYVNLASVPVGGEDSQITESSQGDCLVTRDGEVTASSGYGFSVVFDSQLGSNVDTLYNIPAGSLIPRPADPVRTGYVFEGWYVDESYSRKWDFEADVIREDRILYAGWSVDPDYVQGVTFRLPSGAEETVYLPVGSAIPPEAAPLSESGEGLSWYTSPDFSGEPWNFETGILEGPLTLYGKGSTVTVRFVSSMGDEPQPVELLLGALLDAPVLPPVPGQTHCGWYRDPELTESWDFSQPVIQDMTLYAKWLENYFDSEGNDTGICVEILNPDSFVYTGKAIKPQVVVRDQGKILTPGTDYTVSYKNNTKAADDSVKASLQPQITIQGKGNFKSVKKITVYFSIRQAEMSELEISLPTLVTAKSRDARQTVKVKVQTPLITVPSANYTVLYFTDEGLAEQVSGITAPGLYYIVLEAKMKNGEYTGNFRGRSGAFQVEAIPAAQSVGSCAITMKKSFGVWTTPGSEDAAIAALISKVVLNKVTYTTSEEDLPQFKSLFTVTAVDASGKSYAQEELGQLLTVAGKAVITITAREGNPLDLKGSKSASITIKGGALKKDLFTISFGTNMRSPYSGQSQLPQISTSLTKGEDYVITYKRGSAAIPAYQVKDAGSYTLELQGRGAYTGKLTYKFTIEKVNLSKACAAGQLTITSPGTASYDPAGAKVNFTLVYTNAQGSRVALVAGRDYSVSYSANKKITDTAYAAIRGKGNFSGSLSRTAAPELFFSVSQKRISDSDILVNVTGLTVRSGKITAVKFTLTQSGKTISAREYTSSLEEREDQLRLTITGAGKLYVGKRSIFLSKDQVKTSDSKKVLISLPGGTRYYYTGSQIRPQVTITDKEGSDISACFTITYGANTNAGSGTVTITGNPAMGYYGSKTVKILILPKWAMWLFG